ncbi:hypothetical protein J6590_098824 [Homalodisca vitripennis]|nr:hypothetical protein J6590_098824 [Homalodisca vitripennis]
MLIVTIALTSQSLVTLFHVAQHRVRSGTLTTRTIGSNCYYKNQSCQIWNTDDTHDRVKLLLQESIVSDLEH